MQGKTLLDHSDSHALTSDTARITKTKTSTKTSTKSVAREVAVPEVAVPEVAVPDAPITESSAARSPAAEAPFPKASAPKGRKRTRAQSDEEHAEEPAEPTGTTKKKGKHLFLTLQVNRIY
jgi:hypothetical protein